MNQIDIEWQLWGWKLAVAMSESFAGMMGMIIAFLIAYWLIFRTTKKKTKPAEPVVNILDIKAVSKIPEITVNHLQLLAYHYVNVAPYFNAGPWLDTCYRHLLANGFIYRIAPDKGQHGYRLTDHGNRYVESFLHLAPPPKEQS